MRDGARASTMQAMSARRAQGCKLPPNAMAGLTKRLHVSEKTWPANILVPAIGRCSTFKGVSLTRHMRLLNS